MKKLLSIEVQGKTRKWSFNFYGNPQNLHLWREDGLEVNEVINSVPEWVHSLGLTKPWIFFQDIFNLRNPFK